MWSLGCADSTGRRRGGADHRTAVETGRIIVRRCERDGIGFTAQRSKWADDRRGADSTRSGSVADAAVEIDGNQISARLLHMIPATPFAPTVGDTGGRAGSGLLIEDYYHA